MKIAIIDISGKVIKYDIALSEALDGSSPTTVETILYCPLYKETPKCKSIKLLNLVPQKYKNGEYLLKRLVKVIEVILNYIYLIFNVACQKPDIIHFQWFPLLEVCSGEYLAVKIMKRVSRQARMVLTIHNVYPHSFTEEKKRAYIRRFGSIDKLMNSYIVHTEETKTEVKNAFMIDESRICVVHHGVFTPDCFTPSPNNPNNKDMTFIMYGNLANYKGVDVFVEAMKELPESYKTKVHGVIAGEMQDKVLCKKLLEESNKMNIDWYPYFLPEQELYERINKANVIVLPYKSISQSGVLLLALYFRRFIITSNLPAFKETLRGFSDDMFFESENPKSLAQLMMKYVDGQIDTQKQMNVIENLNMQYSWRAAASKTIELYKKITKESSK